MRPSPLEHREHLRERWEHLGSSKVFPVKARHHYVLRALEHLEHPFLKGWGAPMNWLDCFLSRDVRAVAVAPPPPDEVLEPPPAGLPPEDALELREERAAILEYEAGFTRTAAERMAGLPNRMKGRHHEPESRSRQSRRTCRGSGPGRNEDRHPVR